MNKIAAFAIVLFVLLLDWNSASAIEMPKIGSGSFGSFPSNFPSGNFPFPSKTPKPSATATTSPSSTPTPTPTTVFEITDVDPSSANFMQEFTVYGTNFGSSAGSISFRASNQSFVSAGAPIISWSNSMIKATVPALRKGSYRIQIVRQDGQKSNEEKFTVKNGQPIINSSSISAVNGEFELTFQGTEFGKRGSVDIYNGSSLVGTGIIKSWSTSRVRFELPALSRAQYGFQITAADGRKSSVQLFTVGN